MLLHVDWNEAKIYEEATGTMLGHMDLNNAWVWSQEALPDTLNYGNLSMNSNAAS